MMTVERVLIDSGWQLRMVGGPTTSVNLPDSIPAQVPGCVHTDLMAAGIIEDPFLDNNEAKFAWIGLCDWEYWTTFTVSDLPGAKRFLEFQGLDTVASVKLDGELLLETANQHRRYRCDITELATVGEHLLSITFSSPIRHADKMSIELGYRPHVNHHPYNAIRKMAASFGWDWGIDTATSGVWKPIVLESFDSRINAVRPEVSFSGETGVVKCHVDIDSPGPVNLRVTVGDSESTMRADPGINTVVNEVEKPLLWWPSGRGPQSLYQLKVQIETGETILDVWEGRIGFRSAQLHFPADDDTTGFEFVINGEPTYIRGFNWVPDDALITRITKDRLRERLEQAVLANTNLIRVWGGGIYETDDFYDLCDELGIMVWQDFPFACAAYSEEEPMLTEVTQEAKENIVRLMPHPSLVLWNGNNENLWGFQEWGWEPRLQGKTWGREFYHNILPGLVASLDPGRSYTPGSPFSPIEGIRHNDPNHGSVHIWDTWNEKDYSHFRNYKPRFVAEFGWQGPPTWSTLKRSIHDEPLTPESPGMLVHQKAMLGNDKLTDGLVPHFSYPESMETWHWAMQLNQAIAVWTGLTHMRAEYPRCMGSIVWQLNDGWPATSWAAIDYDGLPKPLYFAIEQSYRDVLWTLRPNEVGLELVIVNDSRVPLDETVQLELRTIQGEVLVAESLGVHVEPGNRSVFAVPDHFLSITHPEGTYLRAGGNSGIARWFFAEYKDLSLEPAAFETELNGDSGNWRVTITARTLLRDLTIQADRIHPGARVDSGMVTLDSGESHTFVIRCKDQITTSDLSQPMVVVTANDLLRRNQDV